MNVIEKKLVDCYEELCCDCSQCSVVLQCASEQKLVPEVEAVMLPVTCSLCGLTFPDKPYHDDHVKTVHSTTAIDLRTEHHRHKGYYKEKIRRAHGKRSRVDYNHIHI